MPIPLISGVTVAFGFLAWSVAAAQYIWPGYKTAATRRSTQADPRGARVQVYRPRSFDSGSCFPRNDPLRYSLGTSLMVIWQTQPWPSSPWRYLKPDWPHRWSGSLTL